MAGALLCHPSLSDTPCRAPHLGRSRALDRAAGRLCRSPPGPPRDRNGVAWLAASLGTHEAVLAKLCQGLDFPAAYHLPSGAASVRLAQQLSLACERSDPAQVWRDTPSAERPSLATLLPPQAMVQIETNLRQLDIDELRFLHHYGPRLSGATDPRELFHRYQVVDNAMLLQGTP